MNSCGVQLSLWFPFRTFDLGTPKSLENKQYVTDHSFAFHMEHNRHLRSIVVMSDFPWVKTKTVLLTQNTLVSNPRQGFSFLLVIFSGRFSSFFPLCRESLRLFQLVHALCFLSLLCCPCQQTWRPQTCQLPVERPCWLARLRW